MVITSNLDRPPNPPALFTSTSILPYFSPILVIFSVTPSSFVTSNPKYSAVIPSAVSSSTLLAPASSSIPFIITVNPSLPNLFATAKPIPPVAPVIIATFPCDSIIIIFKFLEVIS